MTMPRKGLVLPRSPKGVAGAVPLLRRRANVVWTQGIFDICRAVGTAMVAWTISTEVLGHQRPAFAAVAAIVSLAPGIVSYRKQALGMMMGVLTGIVAADLMLAVLPVGDVVLRIGIAVFAAMWLVALVGLTPIMVIQSGVSAALVASGVELGAGFNRIIDALVGGGLALLVSQVLLTPNPFRRVDNETAAFLGEIARSLAAAAEAVPLTSSSAIERAFDPLFERLQRMHAALDKARSIRNWTLRGRLAGERLDGLIKRRRRGAMRVGVAALGLGEALRIAVRADPQALAGQADALRALAAMCGEVETKAPTIISNTPSAGWTQLAEAMDLLSAVLGRAGPQLPNPGELDAASAPPLPRAVDQAQSAPR